MLAALLALGSHSSANEDIAATLDDYLELTVVRDAELSPTGAHIAWRQFRNDFEEDRQDEQLWAGSIADGRTWQLTRGDEFVSDYQWSPNGEWVVFTRNNDVYAISPAGGEAKHIAVEGVGGISSLRFAPDGSALFLLGTEEPDEWAEAREERYGEYAVFREEGNHVHLWRLNLSEELEADEDPEPITEGDEFSVTEFAVAPNGSQIAFVARPTPHLADLLESAVYRVAATGGDVKRLVDPPGAERGLTWRKDGARLAFTVLKGFPDYADIATVSAAGSDLQLHDMPGHNARLIGYDASSVLFEAGVRTDYGRFTIDLETGAIRSLDGPGFFSSTTISADGSRRAFLGAVSGGLAEVLVDDADGRRSITTLQDQTERVWQPRQTLLQWASYDGLEIEGIVTWPRDYVEGKAYPLFVRTHGGPTGTDRPGLRIAPRTIYQPAVLAAHGDGAFVLQTNYRGSAGYGDAFQKTNLRQLGIGPARDIIAGVETLVAQGLVDPDRVGCLGWSQGGHISAMLATYSDVCTAAIMGAGISDWRTYYYNTDITQFTTEYFGATPLEDDDIYALTSPVTYIDRATTPTLIQHGENDARVPIANGYQLRQLLLDRGVESRMIVYAGMGHGPRTPRHRRAITAHALGWFDEYLFGEGRAEFIRPVVPEDAEEEEEEDDSEDAE
ncbi:MAG: prolyl oligopeptidase family serine peptidase [Pseudomonadota bacterium]